MVSNEDLFHYVCSNAFSQATHAKVGSVYVTHDVTGDIELGAVESKVMDLIRSNDVIMFSKSTCPFCLELKRFFASKGVSFAAFEVNETSVGTQIMQVLKNKSGCGTVPNVFIKGESHGGCMDIKALETSGRLDVLLAPFVGKDKNKGPEVSAMGLLWFPETVNGHVVRLTSLLSSIYCILCVIFYRNYATRWAVFALALDYLARITYGASYSVIGSVSSALLVNVTPKWAAGPPKQFAALCGLFFSTFGAGLFLGGQRVGGAIVIALLAGAAACEGVVDFCFGCWMFGLGISFGIIPASVYQPYLNMVSDRKWAYAFMNEKRTFPTATKEHYFLPGQTEPSKVDLVRKDRLELEYKLQDVDVIRHTKIDFFAVPMAVAALAYFFKFTDNTSENSDFNGGFAYQVLAIVSVVLCGLIGIFYGLRMILYPHKIIKEWNHPSFGNYFSAITICITLYGLLLLPKSVNGGGALIWIGSVGQMFIAVIKLSDLIYKPFSDEFLNPSIMMAPVGNYICAIGFATFGLEYDGPDLRGNVNYLYLARMWFAIATLFAIVLFTLTLKRSFNDHYSDNRTRPTLWVWLATSSVAGPAYVAISNDPTAGTGVFFQCLWYISLFFFTVFGIGWIRNFFSYVPDMSIWIIPFSLSAFAMSTIQYQIYADSQLFTTLSIISGAVACGSMAVTGGQTLSWLFDLSLFTPRPKWGPMTFMKLSHEAFRVAGPKLVTMLNGIDGNNAFAIAELLDQFTAFFAAYEEHGKHEEQVIFPRVRRYFPNLNPSMSEEHQFEHAGLEKMLHAIEQYQSANKESAEEATKAAVELLTLLKENFPAWNDHFQNHMRNEENTVTVAVRKYVPIDYQKQMTNEAFELTSGTTWRTVFPYMIKHLPVPAWKSRYIRTFIWANPMRAQEIGLMLYPNLDTVSWSFLAREIPEIVPRGLSGYSRYY